MLPYVINPVHWEGALAAGNFEPAISIKNLEQTEHGAPGQRPLGLANAAVS